MPTATPTKWHGGKSYLSGWLWDIALSADWRPIHVVEPYCGGASFTLEGLARNLPFSFVINDISRELTNFWRVLQDEESFQLFARRAQATPFSEVEFNVAKECPCGCKSAGPCVSCASEFFIRNRQSLAGRMKGFTGITRTRTRRKMNNEVSAWLTVVDGLADFHAMLRKVLILDARPALDVIRSQNSASTLIYADPPYLHETRATTGEYEHEMTRQQHIELLETLGAIEGKFLLSGYWSGCYDVAQGIHGWKLHKREINNHAAGGKTKRMMTECVWTNF